MGKIAKLKNLHTLGLKGTAVTDIGMEEIKSLPNLQKLKLEKTDVSEEKREEMKQLCIANKAKAKVANQPDHMVYRSANPNPLAGNLEVIAGLPRNTQVVGS